MNDELETKVEEIKKDADVQRALKQAASAEVDEAPAARAGQAGDLDARGAADRARSGPSAHFAAV